MTAETLSDFAIEVANNPDSTPDRRHLGSLSLVETVFAEEAYDIAQIQVERTSEPDAEANGVQHLDVLDARVGVIDPIEAYLNEIGKVALLTAEEEVELSQDIEAGLLAAKTLEADNLAPWLERFEGISEDQLREQLRQQAGIGNEAMDRMVKANLRLVVSIARRFNGLGVDNLDLIQDGNLGLYHAVEKFDYTKGYKFSTYAAIWIRQSIGKSVAYNSRSVRVSEDTHRHIVTVDRITKELTASLGRRPTKDEVITASELPKNKVNDAIFYGRSSVSLDKIIGDGSEPGDTWLIDQMSDPKAHLSFENAELSMLVESVLDDSGILSEVEALVLKLRFGLVDGVVWSPKEVAAHESLKGLDINVNRICDKAITKLRDPDIIKLLVS